MKTIYLLRHNPGSTYADKAILRAYERKEDAQKVIDLFATFIRGDLYIDEVGIEAAPTAPPVAQAPLAPRFPQPLFGSGAVRAGNYQGNALLEAEAEPNA